MRIRSFARVALAATITVTAAGCASGSTGSTTSAGSARSATSTTAGSRATALQSAYVRVLKKVGPAVVEITTDRGLGSGVVYDTAGHIVTNAHVVDGSTRFQVTLADGRRLAATLVGKYPADDLAVIEIDGRGLPKPAAFADSAKVQAGDIVLAIGNPLGLASSVTDGIVSNTARTVAEGEGIVLPSMIQTSAPINPGNSGGALVNLRGEVVGIPTLAATDPQLGGGAAPGIGFAIPSSIVTRIAGQLVEHGRVTTSGRAALGIVAATVVDLAGDPAGVLVRSVMPGGAAATAGIAPGSIITSVDGKATPDLATLAGVLADLKPGGRVAVVLGESGHAARTVEVTLSDLAAG
jgi:S1-C subfamily serine protease